MLPPVVVLTSGAPVELNAVPVGASVTVAVIVAGENGRVAVELTTANGQASVTVSSAVKSGVPVISRVNVFVVEFTTLFVETIETVPLVIDAMQDVVADPAAPENVKPAGTPVNVNVNRTPFVDAPPLNCAALRYISI